MRCLDSFGGSMLDARQPIPPSQFERRAIPACKKQEQLFREAMTISVASALINSKKMTSAESLSFIDETIEQTVVRVRRSVLVLYASEFDKKYPGRRSCTVTSTDVNDTGAVFCALRD